jgi:hypothetical protein
LALAPQAASRSPRRQITRDRRLRQPARTSVSSVPADCTHQPGASTPPEARGQRHDSAPGPGEVARGCRVLLHVTMGTWKR